MRFTWNLFVNLPVAYENTIAKKLNYTIDHLFILNHLYSLAHRPNDYLKKREDEDGEIYFLLDYSRVVDDNPFIVLKSISSISRKVKELERDKFITLMNGEHSTRYAKLTEKGLSFFEKNYTKKK